jgi:propionyl-CoA carboxylase alpha chain
MLAKVIAHADQRADAARDLAGFLRGSMISGVLTNRALLAAVLESPDFLSGDTTTAFLDEHPELLGAAAPPEILRRQVLAAAAIVLGDVVPTRDLDLAETAPRAWRNVAGVPEVVTLRLRHGVAERTAVVAREWRREGAAYLLGMDVDDAPVAAQSVAGDDRFTHIDGVVLTTDSFYGLVFAGLPARLEVEGVRTSVHIAADDDARPVSWFEQRPIEFRGPRQVTVRSEGWSTDFEVVEAWAGSGHDGGGAGPTTPVPGTVTHVAVSVGDEVEAGAALVVLEAMKMEHTIRADAAGTVTEIHVSVGQSVDAHTVVATVEASS